jgi:hypothetical protein
MMSIGIDYINDLIDGLINGSKKTKNNMDN